MERKYTTIWYQTIDSTNSEARRRLEELDNLSVLSARCQTAGRGQRGNTWSARPGENLTFSIVLKFGDAVLPPLHSKDQFLISEALTLALTDYLASIHIHCKIKWPNDIYFNDRKICGILMENGVKGDRMASSILGVGLNVNQTDFPDSLPNPVSMQLITREKYDIGEELGRILPYFDERIMMIFNEEGRTGLLETYLERLYRMNEGYFFIKTKTSEKFLGIIRGITPDACLILEDFYTGKKEEFAFKEIKYVIDGREQV